MAYIDVKKLKRSEIGVGVDGDKWIFTKRQKTDTSSRIPMLPLAEELMNKYKSHQECIVYDRVLPVLSNQKMNAYLKEIGHMWYNKKPNFPYSTSYVCYNCYTK